MFPILDHSIIKTVLDISKPPILVYSIDHSKLSLDLKSMVESLLDADISLDVLVMEYNKELISLLDVHAPILTKRVTNRTKPDWANEDLFVLKKKVRKAEKTWRNDKNCNNKDESDRLRQQYRKLVRILKWQHGNNTINDCGNDTRKLYRVINKLTGKERKNPMPDIEDCAVLANQFFGKNNIDKG